MRHLALPALLLLAGCASAGPPASPVSLRQQVMEAERGFARTMADRDHDAFVAYLSDEAVFFAGDTAIHGKAAVAAAWRPFYEGPRAPFSWEPDQVEVLPSGTLALSTGPVFDPGGKVVARFNSIWRREGRGAWRVVFDRGSPLCPPPPPPTP